MYIKIIAFLACVFLLNSCAKLQGLTKSERQEQYVEEPIPLSTNDVKITELEVSSSELANSERNWNEIVDSVEVSDEYHSLDELFNEYTFEDGDLLDGSNSVHVSSAKDYDPLQGKDYIHFDLESLGKGFTYPLPEGKFISNYGIRSGRMHSGVDIKAPKNTDVLSAFDGVVRMAKYYSAYGNIVVVRHYNGLETVYAHNTKNLVKVGDEVASGDVIAKVGRTGRATTEHIHFEVRVAGQYVNPNALIDVHNNTIQKGDLYIYKKGTKIYASNTRPSHIASLAENVGENVTETTGSKTAVKAEEEEKIAAAVYHTIVKGNTLGAIAKKYGTTVSKICQLNNGLTPKTTLKLKQKIRVR
ncbi:MAG: M23 family metallopeptidase [Rikenellaceae bacterium]